MSKERAFPSVAIDDRCGGMTLWDWFAGQVLTGLSMRSVPYTCEEIATIAAKQADAMMAERARRAAT